MVGGGDEERFGIMFRGATNTHLGLKFSKLEAMSTDKRLVAGRSRREDRENPRRKNTGVLTALWLAPGQHLGSVNGQRQHSSVALGYIFGILVPDPCPVFCGS